MHQHSLPICLRQKLLQLAPAARALMFFGKPRGTPDIQPWAPCAQDVAKKRKASDDYTALKQRAPAAVPLPSKTGRPVVSRSKPAPSVPKASSVTAADCWINPTALSMVV